MQVVAKTRITPEFIRKDFLSKILVNPFFWIAFLVFGFSYPIYRSIYRVLPPELSVIGKLPSFKLTNENGQAFGSEDLKGSVYLANFIFTRCPSVCPQMLSEMEKIQKRIRGTGHKVKIVTFTVDPEFDTPEILFKTARDRHANPYTWNFLTHDNKDELFKLYREGFMVGVEQTPDDLMDIAHSEKIVLVDQDGQIRGYYPFERIQIDQLMIDVGLLINRFSTKEN